MVEDSLRRSLRLDAILSQCGFSRERASGDPHLGRQILPVPFHMHIARNGMRGARRNTPFSRRSPG
jgi:hypothetical protein